MTRLRATELNGRLMSNIKTCSKDKMDVFELQLEQFDQNNIIDFKPYNSFSYKVLI